MSKNNSNGTFAAAGGVIKTGGFAARLFAYAVFAIPVYLVFVFIVLISDTELAKNGLTGIMLVDSILVISIVASPFILWERSVRKFRRKNGLSIYKNIEAELA